jgi:hypothetical protein
MGTTGDLGTAGFSARGTITIITVAAALRL